MTLSTSGEVRYEGEWFVGRIGIHTGRVEADKVNDLVGAIIRLGFTDLAPEYPLPDSTYRVTCMPSCEVVLTGTEGSYRVMDRGTGEPPPSEFAAAARLVDAVVERVWDWTPVREDDTDTGFGTSDESIAALHDEPRDWAVRIGRALSDWADARGLQVTYGTGPKQATMGIGLDDASGKRRVLMTCYSPGGVVLQFDNLKLLPPFDDPEARVEFRARLGAIDGIDPERLPDSWPTVRWELLRPETALRKFLDTYDWTVERIRGEGGA